MEDFFNLFQYSNNVNYIDEVCPKIFSNGTKLLEDKSVTNENKEIILSKLINIDPENAFLYFKMGQLFEKVCIEKQMMWYKLAHKKEPTSTYYVLSLFKVLFDHFEYGQVMRIGDDKIETFKNEPFFLNYYAKSKMNLQFYNDCSKYMKIVVDFYSQKKASTMEEKLDKYSNYILLAQLYYINGDIFESIKYAKKAYELSVTFQLDPELSFKLYQSYISLYDYTYYDHKENFDRYFKTNEFLNYDPFFTFKKPVLSLKDKSKIRIGYISSEFFCGPVKHFIYPIIKNHDYSRFEIFIFANKTSIPEKYKKYTHHCYDISNQSDKEVAVLINNYDIDILFDLAGHTVNSRLGVFSYKPAPIQITYLAYPNTTGLSYIDYRITDCIADHMETKQIYSEKLLRMPNCFLLYEPDFTNENRKIRTITKNDKVILASLNKESKNTKHVLNVWRQILNETSNTQLVIKLDSFDGMKERMDYYTKELNVDKNRLLLINRTDDQGYLNLFSGIDILLDTFPYSGTTTSCHALYNSIPIITLYNKDYHAHNVTSSILINSNLSEFVAYSEKDYINITKRLIANPEKINNYKNSRVRDQFLKLMDTSEFMKSYEKLLMNL